MILEHIQKQLLTTQILLESIVEELVEANLIQRDSLDNRVNSKIEVINNSITEIEQLLNNIEEDTDSTLNNINFFGGPVGEA